MKRNLKNKIVGGLVGLVALAGSADALTKRNVLTASASDYASSVGKPLTDYIMVGLHGACYNGERDFYCGNVNLSMGEFTPCQQYLIRQAPEKTEVIVDYIENSTIHNNNCSGTALVRKEKPAEAAKPAVEEK